jgi:hypothetical protein
VVATPRVVDTAGMTAQQLGAAVLAECHGELQGVSRCSVSITLPDGTEVQAFCDLPDRIRAQWPGARMRVLAGDNGFAVDGEQRRDLTADERGRLAALRTLLDAALLGPLYRAGRWERQGEALQLTTLAGDAWTVTLRQLLPIALAGPGGTVRITDWLRTQQPWMQTWIPSRAELAPLGSCQLRFGNEDLVWDDGFFAPPQGHDGKLRVVLPPDGRRPTPMRNLQPSTPSPSENKAMQWLVLDDPGDWPQRAQVYRQYHEVLAAQDQLDAGFVGYQRDGDRAQMILPFRQREGGKPFAPPPGWSIRTLPATPVLEVYPTAGSFAERVAAGSEMLQKELQRRGAAGQGPILAQPFFDLLDGVPPAAKLQNPVVRVSVPLR